MKFHLARFFRLASGDWVLCAYCKQAKRFVAHVFVSKTARLERYQCRECGTWITVEV